MIRNLIAAMAVTVGLLFAGAAAQAYETGYDNRSLEAVRTAAEAGDAMAQLELGNRYYYDAKLKNDAKALEWFKKASDNGSGWGAYEVATMYVLGESVETDYAAALRYYKLATERDVVLAYYDIGLMYIEGEGVDKDPAEAARWLTIGAEKGSDMAQARLGEMYRDGQGVEKDTDKAIALIKAAVKQGLPRAAKSLKVMYRDGKGVETDRVRAAAWGMMVTYLTQKKEGRGDDYSFLVKIHVKLTDEENTQARRIFLGLMAEMGFRSVDPNAIQA